MIARIGIALAWLAAGVVAVAVLHRCRRGRPVVLTGRFSPRFVRMVAIVLVLLGIGTGWQDRAAGGAAGGSPTSSPSGVPRPQEPADSLPATVSEDTVANWVRLQRQPPSIADREPSANANAAERRRHERLAEVRLQAWWPRLKLAVTRGTWDGNGEAEDAAWLAHCSPTLARQLAAEVGAGGKSVPSVSPREALAALEELESHGVYDLWLASYLWRRGAPSAGVSDDDRAQLYARLHRHARVTHALVAAHAQMRPIMDPPPVWRTKGGPNGELAREIQNFERAARELFERARKLYPQMRAGGWQQDGLVELVVADEKPAPTLIRAGERSQIDARVRIGRLDLIATAMDAGTVLAHESIGRIEIPAARVVGVHELPSLLAPEAAAAVQALVKQSLDGDEQAALEVERALPLTHAELRAALGRAPTAAGAPRLRLILALFDDVPMPVIPQPPIDPPKKQ